MFLDPAFYTGSGFLILTGLSSVSSAFTHTVHQCRFVLSRRLRWPHLSHTN